MLHKWSSQSTSHTWLINVWHKAVCRLERTQKKTHHLIRMYKVTFSQRRNFQKNHDFLWFLPQWQCGHAVELPGQSLHLIHLPPDSLTLMLLCSIQTLLTPHSRKHSMVQYGIHCQILGQCAAHWLRMLYWLLVQILKVSRVMSPLSFCARSWTPPTWYRDCLILLWTVHHFKQKLL